MLLKGKKRKDTVCIALVEEGLEDSSIRMSKVRALPFIMCCNMYSIPYCSQRPCWFAGLYGDKELLTAKRRGCWGECVCEAFRPSARFRVSLSVLPRVLVCWYCHELLLVPHTRLRTNTCTRRVDSKYLHTAYSTAYSTPNSAFGTHLQYTDNHPMDDGWWVMDDGR